MGSQAAQLRLLHRTKCIAHALGGKNLLGAGQIGQPGGAIDRVAVAIAVDFHHLARLDAHLHLHRIAGAPSVDRIGAEPFLDRQAGGERVTFGGKHHEQPITQQLDDTPVMLLERLGKRGRQLRDETAGGFIAEPLEDAGAADQISKNNGGHDGSALRERWCGESIRSNFMRARFQHNQRKRAWIDSGPFFTKRMVGVAGFELATPCTPCKCATRLRYTPTSR